MQCSEASELRFGNVVNAREQCGWRRKTEGAQRPWQQR
jgi:hypothetical protein